MTCPRSRIGNAWVAPNPDSAAAGLKLRPPLAGAQAEEDVGDRLPGGEALQARTLLHL